MALELNSQFCEGCEKFSYVDTTGAYSGENPTGYGPENLVDDPADFDSYTLEVWYPGSDIEGDPNYTYNLLLAVPIPDADGHYTWAITKEMLGLDVIVSGTYNIRATGVKGLAIYITDASSLFIKDLESKVDTAMRGFDPSSPCKKGCVNKAQLYAEFLTVKCGGVCDSDKADFMIRNLYNKTKNCC